MPGKQCLCGGKILYQGGVYFCPKCGFYIDKKKKKTKKQLGEDFQRHLNRINKEEYHAKR